MSIVERLSNEPVQIKNFIDENLAESIYNEIENYNLWEVSSNYKKSYLYEKKKYEEGEFSFWFDWINNNEFVHKIKEKINFEFNLSKLLDGHYSKIESIFISRYTFGHFLSPHDDINTSRKYAFVYNLTKNSNIDNGGCLNFINDTNEIVYKFLPEFNSLTLFDVKNIPYLHYVDEIKNNKYKRYALSGWLCETEIKTKLLKTII